MIKRLKKNLRRLYKMRYYKRVKRSLNVLIPENTEVKKSTNKNLSLRDSLIENDSIRLNQSAKTWQDAVRVATQPLVEKGSVEDRYVDAIIASTEQYGPYYILMPGMAMPHARPEDGVRKDSFSLVTLQDPVTFSDGKEVSVLLTLAATSSDIHLSVAIPQIIAVFELDDIVNRLLQATTKEEVIHIIDEADYSAYLPNN